MRDRFTHFAIGLDDLEVPTNSMILQLELGTLSSSIQSTELKCGREKFKKKKKKSLI